jgi:hypothetical protein
MDSVYHNVLYDAQLERTVGKQFTPYVVISAESGAQFVWRGQPFASCQRQVVHPFPGASSSCDHHIGGCWPIVAGFPTTITQTHDFARSLRDTMPMSAL